MRYSLKCLSCGRVFESTYKKQTCGYCDGLLEVDYAYSTPRRMSDLFNFWKYQPFLPAGRYTHYALGGTKLIPSLHDSRIYLKLELENPTRSFKDRGSVVEIGKAQEYGYKEIVCASTGNMAFSLSYFAKLAGIRSVVYVSSGANKDKVTYIRQTHDAEVRLVKGDFTKAQQLAFAYAKRHKGKAFLTGDYCYRKEGQKTVAYEIMDQIGDVTHIVMPVGNATLFSAVYKALKEMQLFGLVEKMPKFVAVQAHGCDPVVKAFEAGTEIAYQKPKTKADAIAVGMPTFGNQALGALKETGGLAVSVTEEEMEEEQRRFHEEYALVAERAGVASIVAAKKLELGEEDVAVAIVSGGNV